MTPSWGSIKRIAELRPWLVVLLAGLVWQAPSCVAADKKQLSAALAAVDANLKTDAGKRYDAQIGKDFHDHPVNLKPCKQPGTALPGSFDLLLRLKADGKVDQALVYPESQFANCARDAFSAARFSPPPHGDYWVNIHMQFSK